MKNKNSEFQIKSSDCRFDFKIDKEIEIFDQNFFEYDDDPNNLIMLPSLEFYKTLDHFDSNHKLLKLKSSKSTKNQTENIEKNNKPMKKIKIHENEYYTIGKSKSLNLKEEKEKKSMFYLFYLLFKYFF